MHNEICMTGVEHSKQLDEQVQSTLQAINKFLGKKSARTFLTVQPEPQRKNVYSVMIIVSGLPRVAKSKASGGSLIQAIKSAQKKVIQQIVEMRKRQRVKKHRQAQASYDYAQTSSF